MAFSAIKRITGNVKTLTVQAIAAPIWNDKYMQAQVIELNTDSQLYDKGVDADGVPIGQYSPFTVDYKQSIAGRLGNDTRTDHITLKDTGDFYRSFRFVPLSNGFEITADTDKGGGDDLAEMYGRKILGLTDESIQQIIPEVTEIAITETRKAITR